MGLDPLTMMAGASVVSGLMGAGAASSAADTQAAAANEATAAQKGMFDKTVQLESPFRQTGMDAMSKLSYLLGIGSPNGAGGSAGPQETADQIRARLAPQFTSGPAPMSLADAIRAIQSGNTGFNSPTVDNAGLDAAVQAELARQSPSAATPQQMGGDYGSLLKPFGMEDFQLDPGIQFQMKYGQQALQNSQAAKDGVLTGGATKDLMSFNQGLAGTGYQSAFDRYMANKNLTLGSLMDMTKLGQAAAGNTVNAAPQFSSGMASTITGAGNAAASGQIGTANALAGGLTGAATPYYLRNLMQTMQGSAVGGSTPASLAAGSPLSPGLIFSNGSLGD